MVSVGVYGGAGGVGWGSGVPAVSYARGAARERELEARLEEQGWDVTRSAGSKGKADLVALCAGKTPRYIEVKATAAGPFAGFSPADRRRLALSAARAGAVAELCWWPYDRRGPRWYPVDTWPTIP